MFNSAHSLTPAICNMSNGPEVAAQSKVGFAFKDVKLLNKQMVLHLLLKRASIRALWGTF
jgi:hypothetical protein